MRTLAIIASIVVGLMLAPLTLKTFDRMVAAKTSAETMNQMYQKQEIPTTESSLTISLSPKAGEVKKTITLEAKNMIVLRGPVTASSVGTTMKKLQIASDALPKDTAIYLVLDTPGGSIMDGLDLIDFAAALPQKVHTVTLFAASMGFQIAQNLNTRYIIRNGTLMSHRASVSGLGGQVKGELETRYKTVRRAVDFLDFKAYTRMGMAAKDYENLILHEYWVYGFDAVAAKAADEEVLLRCGTSLTGSEDVPFDTIFGKVTVTFSQCPLIKAPEKIDLSQILNKDKNEEVKQLFGMALEDKPSFVREFITTDRFSEVFK